MLPRGTRSAHSRQGAEQDGTAAAGAASIAPPAIALPKGGGAIRGIGEKFAANPVTGTGSITVPIGSSPGRAGFSPQLALSYDSGAGNGAFGLGWNLSLPAITRKTDKGLPLYRDADESDVFILSGAEDLVPVLVEVNGQWQRQRTARVIDGVEYVLDAYRPRVEGLFARIERWTNTQTGEAHWRSISRDNITTVYGKDNRSRISDPADPKRIFSWLICESYDDKGNVIVYDYKAENSDGVDLAQAHEQTRTPISRSAQRYLKRVKYGNRTSRLVQPDLRQTSWLFELVFDYGEHGADAPTPNDSEPWLCRHDPFSSYRAGFEVRTYRLCQRVLMFHHFPSETGVGENCLVRSTDFSYRNSRNNPDDTRQGNPFASFIAAITQSGYRRQASGYLKKSFPPLEFAYSAAQIHEEIQEIDAASLENLPYGLDNAVYQWVDLNGEGVSGILLEQSSAWFYKPNLGGGRFGPLEQVAPIPSLADIRDGRQQLLDLAGDGQLDLVAFSSLTPGFFERTEADDWTPFTPFAALPNISWDDPNLRFVDLNGDGHADVLIAESTLWTWYPSLAEAGFGPAQHVRSPLDEHTGPRLVFADGTQSIYLADMSGDGLTDLVRIRNGEICYWPNLGYGRFGARVTMDNAPWFDFTEQFDQRRLRLADIDGSGTNDIIYLGRDSICLYFNQAGNGWSEPRRLNQFPRVDHLSSVTTVDLLGNGTACLVWSSPLPNTARRPVRYIDLMGGQKPHLLTRVKNNLGAETVMSYVSSTQFYLADRAAGRPWITRLPFPVHVVERIETFDRISRNRFVTRFAYHHGYFDGIEREFRGFGLVEQWDTEEYATLAAVAGTSGASNIDAASHVPPTLSRMWFHTGAYRNGSSISRQFDDEYYREAGLRAPQAQAMLLDDTLLPDTVRLGDGSQRPYVASTDEVHEACRALKGTLLRQEIYALDGSEAQHRPYRVSERNYTIDLLQPRSANRHAVYVTAPRETVDFHYDRKLYPIDGQQLADPRVAHTLTLALDMFGNVLQSAAVSYGRRYDDPDPWLTDADRQRQKQRSISYTENRYTNPVLQQDTYRLPQLSETMTYELLKLTPDVNEPDVTNLFRFAELRHKIQAASDGQHDLPYEDVEGVGAVSDEPYRRLIEHARTLYRRDDLTGPLPLGQLQGLGLTFETYQLALTSGLLRHVYTRKRNGVDEALLTNPASMLGADGRYIRSNDYRARGWFPNADPDDRWWLPSGQMFFAPDSTAPAAQELAYARQHFFLPHRLRDAFGEETRVSYDAYNLLNQELRDALDNRITAGERDVMGTLVQQGNDYRVLRPWLVMDANRNRTVAVFDALGLVVGTVVMGKPGEQAGDTLADFEADLTDSVIVAHLQNPLTDPHSLLQHATKRLVYDLFAYWRTQAEPQPQPVVVYTLARETHELDLASGQQTNIQHSFAYSDGFGREIQRKIQAEPGPLVANGPETSPRWVGSGWKIFNNKGQPVRQYEPFFSASHRFEFAQIVGVSSILFYDPVGRVVATLHPNHTYGKVVFDPWRQATWDVNDTVLQTDPKADVDVGHFFARLPDAVYLPTWYAQRQSGALGPEEQAAAAKASAHADTPTIGYFDSLGRPFVTVDHNRFTRNGTTVEERYARRVSWDIEGNERAVVDARNRVVMRYDYDMLGNRIHQISMDTGARWVLNDVTGNPIYSWNSRDQIIRSVYDRLRRPAQVFLRDGAAPEVETERLSYGEAQPNPEAHNLRTRVYQVCDGAGIVTNEAYDFKGNRLRITRQLAVEYKNALNWSASVALEQQSYTSHTTYDALNRPTMLTAPDNSVIRPFYNEANLLERIEARLRGAATATAFISDIDYNARGQRTLIAYGNGATTHSSYDPITFRLTHLFTTRGAAFPNDCPNPPNPPCGVQNLRYIYDAVGNITSIRDDAQQTNYFRNRRVEPSTEYTYDAIYRLIETTGREHLGQAGNSGISSPTPTSFTDAPRVGLAQPGNGDLMGRYFEQYVYDEVGNFLELIHRGTDPVNPGWRRSYSYSAPSLLDPTKLNNRLTGTQIGGDAPQPYTYDAHGNMITMPHLPLMRWNYRDQLQATAQQVVNSGTPETTYYVYDATGQRVRKVTERQTAAQQTPNRKAERIYLGGFEIYREYGGSGNKVNLERETLQIMVEQQRIAIIETRTQGNDGLPAQLIRYQISNHLGSASLELDSQAQIISYEEYYAYGGTSYQAGRNVVETGLKRYRYSAKERDEENGLYYHGARYYAPWLGRWTAPDPAEHVDGLNVFGYVRNNPILLQDPSGKSAEAMAAGKAWERQVFDKVNKQIPIVEQVTVKAKINGKTVESVLDALGRDAQGWVVLESKLNPSTKLTPEQTLIRQHLASGGSVTISATDKAKIAELRDKLKVGPNTSVSTSRYKIINRANASTVLAELDVIPKGHTTILHTSGDLTVHSPEEMKQIQALMQKHPGMDMTAIMEKAKEAASVPGKAASATSDLPSGKTLAKGAATLGGALIVLKPVAAAAGPIGDVVEVGMGAKAVADAPPEERGRVAAEETGSLLGGAGGAAVGVAGGTAAAGGIAVLLGLSGPPGWLVLGLGVVGAGVGGYFGSEAGRAGGRALYED